MKKKNYPKILILGETFHSKSGGGITLKNLFSGWPKEQLFNACEYYKYNLTDSDICAEYYQIGDLENHVFPSRFIRKLIPLHSLNNSKKSGLISINFEENSTTAQSIEKTLTYSFKKLLRKLSFAIGIYPLFHIRNVSEEFVSWVNKVKPDFIYTQFSDYNSILFTKELIKQTNVPLCIHIMDDWPSTYSQPGLFYYYWRKRIDFEFREVIKISKICMSISEGMSKEYRKRYGKKFLPFHNPIDPDFWMPHVKKKFDINTNNITVLYAGRIDKGISKALSEVVKTIDELRKMGYQITLFLQSPPVQDKTLNKYLLRGTVRYNPQVEYFEIPLIFSSADILILPYDFSSSGFRFIKYSMPTKASEFMMSGTPILMYCSEQVYIAQNAFKNGWAYLVNKKDKNILKKAFIDLIDKKELRETLSNKALNFALTNYDKKIICNNFLKVFQTHLKK